MNRSKPKIYLKPIILGTLMGMVCICALLIIFSFIMLKSGHNSSEVLDILSLITLSIGTFVSGYTSGRISKTKGLLYGFFCSIAVFSFIVLGAIVSNGLNISLFSVFKALICMVFGCGGGIVGVNRN